MLTHNNARLALAALPLLVAACSNTTGRPAPVLAAPASCDELCEASEEACGPADSCMRLCRSEEAVAEFVGCEASQSALTGCRLDQADVCDGYLIADLCVHEQAAHDACVTDACSLDPSSPICRDHCLATCYASDRCDAELGDGQATCAEVCDGVLDEGLVGGCSREVWDVVMCALTEMPDAACSPDVCEVEARAAQDCLGIESPQPVPQPTTGASYYEACNDTECAEGTCLELGTATTRGSFCTAACVSTADCPGSTAICMQTTEGNGYCVETCGYEGEWCGTEMLCRYQASAYDYLCVPDL